MSSISNDLIVHSFPCLADNYGFLIHDPLSGETACIDTPDAEAIDRQLCKNNWRLTSILNTHHHWDHIAGNLFLKDKYQCQVLASAYDKDRIPGIDRTLQEGDSIYIGGHQATVFETPGHTLGHIVYYFAEQKRLFVGDTLFALGCGRLFEGSAEQMHHSLAKIKSLPDDLSVHCAHEYTAANARFALSIDNDNPRLNQRAESVQQLRAEGLPTVPFLLQEDKQTNPFLQADSVTEFARLRQLKDNF